MSRKQPVFSVVLPVYNRAGMIGFAIRSVLGQTFEDFELIVVDDGSTDGTRRVVDDFSDPRIRYFYKENEERSIARNYGIARAEGMYVNFIDSDDYFFPHHLETAYRFLSAKGFPELVHLAYEIHGAEGELLLRRKLEGDEINRELIFENILHPGSLFVRRTVLDIVSFIPHPDAMFAEDWCLSLQLAARFPIHTLNEVSNVVREHSDRSLNRVDPVRMERALLLVADTLANDRHVRGYYGAAFSYFLCECYSLIALYYVSVNRRKSVHYFFRAFAAYPRFPVRKRFWAILKNFVLTPAA